MDDVIDTRRLRNALGCFATGVAIVTTKSAGQAPMGLTINSFSSVSLEPPLVLWCLDKSSETLAAFTTASHFVINILREEHQELSNRFSQRGHHHLDGVEVLIGTHGIPALRNALSHFECAIEAQHDAGDHVILVGRVVAFDYAEEGHPLLYYRGKYSKVG